MARKSQTQRSSRQMGMAFCPEHLRPKPVKSSRKKSSWRDLPAAEKAAHLLDTITIPDRVWTDEQRAKGESRAAFIRRVLLGETAPDTEPVA